jgi:hypothetical protein
LAAENGVATMTKGLDTGGRPMNTDYRDLIERLHREEFERISR